MHPEEPVTPYYADDTVTLYHGDMREILPGLNLAADCIVTDPPYELMHRSGTCTWDAWPDGWPALAAGTTRSMWCFGTFRMFMRRAADIEAAGWRLSDDVVWSKEYGTGVTADRFRRSHEIVTHWYQGQWRDIYHQTPRVPSTVPRVERAVHHRPSSSGRGFTYTHRPIGAWEDDGLRYALSVLKAAPVRGGHPTEKPVPLLDLLIRYACPESGLVLDPFAGSGSTGEAARLAGRRAVLIEGDERYCEATARRLAQDVLPMGVV